MKNRNIKKFFSFVLCSERVSERNVHVFALGLNHFSTETPWVTVSGMGRYNFKHTSFQYEGGNLDWELGQWATFRINAAYDLAGKNVKRVTKLQLPLPRCINYITSDSFEIRDINTNRGIAHATVDAENKN